MVTTMADLSESELKDKELDLRQGELDLQRAKLFIDFAKYGFGGTLAAGLGGMGLLLSLASLNAFTTVKIETWGLVSIALLIVVGAIAFGFLSLWELPRIVARLQKMEMSFNSDVRTRNDVRSKK